MANAPTTKSDMATQAAENPNQALAPLGSQPNPMMLGSDAYRVGLEPTTLAEAYQLASMIALTGICKVTSPEDALIRILTGRSLGLSTMQSLRGVYNVDGRPSLDASLMQALCLQSPLCESFDFVDGDDTFATYKTQRKGRPARELTYTLDDAKRQMLIKDGGAWVKTPKQMLRARAKSELARLEYPDLMFGMYSREELEAGIADGDVEDRVAKIRKQEGEEIEVEFISPVRAAVRDYAGEADALIAKARAAKTRPEMAAIRQSIEAWDGVPPHRDRVVEAYNEAKKAARAAAAPAAAAPMPDGNLFAGKEPEKP